MDEIEIEIGTGQSIQNINQLRREMQELRGQMATAEGEEFQKLSQRASELNAEMSRTNSLVTASGSAFTNFNTLLGRTSKSLLTLDFGQAAEQAEQLRRVSQQLTFREMTKGLGQARTAIVTMGKAILANPIMLLGATVIGISVALYKFRDSIPFVTDALDFLKSMLDSVIGALKQFTDWLGLTTFAETELAEEAERSAQRRQQAHVNASESIIGDMEHEVAMMRATGASIEDIEDKEIELAKKRVALSKDNLVYALNELKAAQARGEATQEQVDRVKELTEETQKGLRQLEILQAQTDTNRQQRAQERYEKAKELREKEQEEIRAQLEQEKRDRIAKEERTAQFIEGIRRQQRLAEIEEIEDEIERNQQLQLQKLEWAKQDIDFEQMTAEAAAKWKQWEEDERTRIEEQAKHERYLYEKDIEEKREKERKEREEREAQAFEDLQRAKADALFTGLGIAQMIAGKNENVANAIFAVEQGLAAAELIVDSIKRKGQLMAQLATGTAMSIAGNPAGLAMIAGAKAGLTSLATSTASGLAGIAGASISRFSGGGGSVPSMGGGGAVATAPTIQAPQPSFSNFRDDLAGDMGVSSQGTFILESELSDNQERQMQLKRKKMF